MLIEDIVDVIYRIIEKKATISGSDAQLPVEFSASFDYSDRLIGGTNKAPNHIDKFALRLN